MAPQPIASDPTGIAAIGIAARLDRLPVTWLHGAVVVLCALGLLFDVVEAALSNALSAVFSAPPYNVRPDELSWLLASVFAGGAVGAPLLGLVADRYGRRLALASALLLLTVASLLAATSRDIASLTMFRALSGLALGAYPPLMVAYLSDVLPPARRGTLTLVTGAIGFLGAPAVIFLIRWLTPLQPLGLEAWRWALVLGAIGSVIVGALFWLLPESPRWLATAGRRDAAERACRRFEQAARVAAPLNTDMNAGPETAAPESKKDGFWSPVTGRQHRWRALLLGGLYFLSPWATIGFPLLSGAVLVAKGFHVSDSLLYVGVTMFGPTIGALAGAIAIDRIERRTALALCAGAKAVLGLAFAFSDAPLALMVTGVAFNLIGAIYIATLSVYGAELFPTHLRAAASAGAWSVNRIASACVPLLLLPLLKTQGVVAMFSVLSATLVAGIVLVLVFGPRGLARKPVE